MKHGGTEQRRVVVRLDVQLFGTPRFTVEGKPWPFGGPPGCFKLLAFLAVRREPVRRAVVAATLWPDELDVEARANLRRHLHQVRAGLPRSEIPWIVDERGAIGWNPAAPVRIDVLEFETLAGDTSTRAEALALYAGDLLQGYDDEWLVIERERLQSTYLDALLELAAERRRERNFAASVAYAERLLAHDDLREEAVRELMAARYEAGERSMALATYERFRTRLRALLDVDPAQETVMLADAIRAHAALATDDAGAPQRAEGWQPRFVGRSGELETLRRAWVRAARGSGTSIFVGGEAGIGKSRLAAELMRIVRAEGARIVIGTTSDPEAEPYQALVVGLRRVLAFALGDGDDPQTLATLARILPELRGLRRDLPADDGLSGEPARVRLFDAIARFVERLALARPLLLVLEDLHWAGEATTAAVAALARRIGSLPVLIVVTFRSDELDADHALRRSRAQLVAEQRASSISLRRLDARSIEHMLQSAGLDGAPDDVAQDVHRISDGNPLFVVQLAQGYLETGTLVTNDVPRGLRDVIARRIARLAPNVRDVGEVAAAVGETFSVVAVTDVGGWDEGWVLDALNGLIDASMIREAGAGEYAYAFTHALITGAMYDATPEPLRAARHRRIARVLERDAGEDRASLETIARHWRRAGDGTRASAAYLRAATGALDVFARAEAIAFARLAHECALDDRARFDALAVACAAPVGATDRAGWDGDLDQLEAVASRLGDDELFTALAMRAKQLYLLTSPDDERAVTDRMVALAEAGDDHLRRAIAYDARGFMLAARGDLADAANAFRRALDAAERAGSETMLFQVRMHWVSAAQRLGDDDAGSLLAGAEAALGANGGTFEQRRLLILARGGDAFIQQDGALLDRVGSEMLRLAVQAQDADLELRAHAHLAYATHQRYDAAATRMHFDAAMAICERTGNTRMRGLLLVNRAAFETEMGRLNEARALYREISASGEAFGSRLVLGFALGGHAQCEHLAGAYAKALSLATEAHAVGVATADQRLIAETFVDMGAAEAALGDAQLAVRHLRAGVVQCREGRASRSLPDALAHLIEVLVDLGAREEARAAADELQRLDSEITVRLQHPMRVARALACEALARGDRAAADAALASGRAALDERLKLLGPDAAAHAALPFNRAT